MSSARKKDKYLLRGYDMCVRLLWVQTYTRNYVIPISNTYRYTSVEFLNKFLQKGSSLYLTFIPTFGSILNVYLYKNLPSFSKTFTHYILLLWEKVSWLFIYLALSPTVQMVFMKLSSDRGVNSQSFLTHTCKSTCSSKDNKIIPWSDKKSKNDEMTDVSEIKICIKTVQHEKNSHPVPVAYVTTTTHLFSSGHFDDVCGMN